ncbi:hypothetical protein UJ101_02582 [Flavobacteriaceae bacterium UJ101]|nr:hypothetical protein UJ101_02582 [Flavobacteriaceae bacterium UJ101]
MRFYCTLLFLLITTFSTYASGQEVDTLQNKTLEELSVLYKKHISVRDSIAIEYAKALVKKAKEENNPFYLFRAYYNSAYSIKKITKKYDISLKYVDSAIMVFKEGFCEEYSKLNINLADAYHSKGSTLLTIYNEPKEALELFLKGQEYLKKCSDKVSEKLIESAISFIYTEMGEYEKALKIDRKRFFEIKKKSVASIWDKETYLITLEHLVISYMNINQYYKALELIKKGIKKSQEFKIERPRLYQLESECYYRLEEYRRALSSIDSAWYYYKSNNKMGYEIYHMNGLIYDQLKISKKSIYSLRKADSLIFKQENFTLEQAEGYKVLLTHYKKTKQYDSQLYYTNRYLYIDSVLDERYKSFSNQIKERYEIPNLIEEREILIEKLEERHQRKQYYIYGLVLLGSLVGFIGLYYYQKQKKYKKAFQKLQSGNVEEKPQSFKETSETKSLTLSKEVVEDLSKKLEVFEQEKQFLSSKMNLQRMARLFKSNSLYISKVINCTKQKNFSTYINDLRIDESIKILQEKTTFQNYTVKALAEEFGFSSTQAFSKAFYKRTEMYPSYFIKQLKKEK